LENRELLVGHLWCLTLFKLNRLKLSLVKLLYIRRKILLVLQKLVVTMRLVLLKILSTTLSYILWILLIKVQKLHKLLRLCIISGWTSILLISILLWLNEICCKLGLLKTTGWASSDCYTLGLLNLFLWVDH